MLTGEPTCVSVDRRGTVRGTRLSVAGNSSERNVWARMTRSECDILSHCSSGCMATDCGGGSMYCLSTDLQAPSSIEQDYTGRSLNVSARIGERQENIIVVCRAAGWNRQLLPVYGVHSRIRRGYSPT